MTSVIQEHMGINGMRFACSGVLKAPVYIGILTHVFVHIHQIDYSYCKRPKVIFLYPVYRILSFMAVSVRWHDVLHS